MRSSRSSRTFNPTLVRLRHGSRVQNEKLFDFQSHLGSIAATRAQSPRRGCLTLSIPPWFDCGQVPHHPVRPALHLSIPPWFDCGLLPFPTSMLAISFQSHLGSIAARRPQRPQHRHRQLSIPPWFDCGSYASCRGASRCALSIPPWFDCGFYGLEFPRADPGLSIPPWFDCGAACAAG